VEEEDTGAEGVNEDTKVGAEKERDDVEDAAVTGAAEATGALGTNA
jgi:hypothetical protein